MLLYHGKIFALYFQIALFDNDSLDSYPEWETGEETAVFGEKGVAISTATDTEIEVWVTNNPIQTESLFLIAAGSIQIGSSGALLGNVVSGDLTLLDLPPGRLHLQIYTNSLISTQVTQVNFVVS